MNSLQDTKKAILELIRKKSNSYCADCSDLCALYVDMNNKIFICQNCATIHQQLGFKVKNVANDDFSPEEVKSLETSDNQQFNNLWMSNYSYDCQKIPFGASLSERRTFLTDKYINKKWYSPFQTNTFSFGQRHFFVEDEYSDSFEQQTPYVSSSDQSDFSDISSPNEQSLFGINTKQIEVEAPSIQKAANFSDFLDSSDADESAFSGFDGFADDGQDFLDDSDFVQQQQQQQQTFDFEQEQKPPFLPPSQNLGSSAPPPPPQQQEVPPFGSPPPPPSGGCPRVQSNARMIDFPPLPPPSFAPQQQQPQAFGSVQQQNPFAQQAQITNMSAPLQTQPQLQQPSFAPQPQGFGSVQQQQQQSQLYGFLPQQQQLQAFGSPQQPQQNPFAQQSQITDTSAPLPAPHVFMQEMPAEVFGFSNSQMQQQQQSVFAEQSAFPQDQQFGFASPDQQLAPDLPSKQRQFSYLSQRQNASSRSSSQSTSQRKAPALNLNSQQRLQMQINKYNAPPQRVQNQMKQQQQVPYQTMQRRKQERLLNSISQISNTNQNQKQRQQKQFQVFEASDSKQTRNTSANANYNPFLVSNGNNSQNSNPFDNSKRNSNSNSNSNPFETYRNTKT